ncbi:MAG: pilus assembly protein TadG-related protein, partial [Candidatus Limnocylindrales bacterium]
MPSTIRLRQRGQMLALFGLSLTVILLGVGLVIDGGTALVQRRASQNAADFAALAGARVVAEKIGGDLTNGTDSSVKAAITNSISVNKGTPPTFGAPDGPAYVDGSGATVGYVGAGVIPASAVGVTVNSTRTWTPYFLGIIGMNNWSASAVATARGGYSAGGPGTGVFPAGIAEAFFSGGRTPCAGPVSTDPTSACYPQHLTPGDLNVPGGFGWLKFGCSGYGLG